MFLFIDFLDLDNSIASEISKKTDVGFIYNIPNVSIQPSGDSKVKYFSISNAELNPNAVKFIFINKGNLNMTIQNIGLVTWVMSVFKTAKIFVRLGDGDQFPHNLPINANITFIHNPNMDIKNLIYSKLGLMIDCKSMSLPDQNAELIDYLINYNVDKNLTLNNIDVNQLKILMVKRTKLADAPDELMKAILKHTPHKVEIDSVPREGFNIIHYNNVYIEGNHKNKVIQFHSEPSRVTFETSGIFKDFPKTKLVLNQYHATLPEYENCIHVRNVINFDNDLYNVQFTSLDGPIKIGYSPSITQKVNEYFDKGYEETKKILESVDGIAFDIITGVSLEECIKRKSKCDIIIDECVTGSYHRSGLEGLALGKMTICWMKPEVEKVFMTSSKSREFNPFENVKITDLKSFLERCVEMGKEKIQTIGKRNRIWMEEHWNPKDIANEFIEIYQNVIGI